MPPIKAPTKFIAKKLAPKRSSDGPFSASLVPTEEPPQPQTSDVESQPHEDQQTDSDLHSVQFSSSLTESTESPRALFDGQQQDQQQRLIQAVDISSISTTVGATATLGAEASSISPPPASFGLTPFKILTSRDIYSPPPLVTATTRTSTSSLTIPPGSSKKKRTKVKVSDTPEESLAAAPSLHALPPSRLPADSSGQQQRFPSYVYHPPHLTSSRLGAYCDYSYSLDPYGDGVCTDLRYQYGPSTPGTRVQILQHHKSCCGVSDWSELRDGEIVGHAWPSYPPIPRIWNPLLFYFQSFE